VTKDPPDMAFYYHFYSLAYTISRTTREPRDGPHEVSRGRYVI